MCSVLPRAFQSTLHGVLTAPDGDIEEERMVEGVRATLRAGGCNASRASFIAACHAAQVRGMMNKERRMRCEQECVVNKNAL